MKNKICIIKETILEAKKPFSICQLLDELISKGIKNKELIFTVLDQLLNDGLVSYDDFVNDVPYYKSLFACVIA